MSPRLVNAYSRMIAVAAVGLAYRRHEITLDEQQAELAEIRRWRP